MRKAAVTLALLASLGAVGCGSQGNADDANRSCRGKGGILSSDWHGGTVVCADKRSYPAR